VTTSMSSACTSAIQLLRRCSILPTRRLFRQLARVTRSDDIGGFVTWASRGRGSTETGASTA
jgi:hypothetical protein